MDHRRKVWEVEARVINAVSPNNKGIVQNLEKLAKESQVLVLWLDCDREGEAIAFEVIEICRRVNSRLDVFRAIFSTVTREDMLRAYNDLKRPNPFLRDAVAVRQEVDLRLGAAFTRLQTLGMRNLFNFQKKVISYGPCQLPTLGFVVERFIARRDFVPEKYWHITCEILFEGLKTKFTWQRIRLFDQIVAAAIYEELCLSPKCFISHVSGKPVSKWKPKPLNTVDFVKLAVSKLKFPSQAVMSIAEKLYNKGLISYPRTETNSYNPTINIRQLVSIQKGSRDYGDYASKLIDMNNFESPKGGNKDDKSHPPIHPLKIPSESLTREEQQVYDLITRHFLATCSKDARGFQTSVTLAIVDETFSASGLTVTQKNWLEIFPFDKWAENTLPSFFEGQSFDYPDCLFFEEGITTAPSLLTEKDLISLMDKNGIGTDATMHEHIKTIQDREYAVLEGGFFKPKPLGLAIVEGYNSQELDLAKPTLRAEMEEDMGRVANGTLDRETAVSRPIERMLKIFQFIVVNQKAIFEKMLFFYRNNGGNPRDDDDPEGESGDSRMGMNGGAREREVDRSIECTLPFAPRNKYVFECKKCKKNGFRVKSGKKVPFLGCGNYPECLQIIFLPFEVEKVEISDIQCENCFKKGETSFLCRIGFKDSVWSSLPADIIFTLSEEQDPLFCLAGCDVGLEQLGYQPKPKEEDPQRVIQYRGDYRATNQSSMKLEENQTSRNFDQRSMGLQSNSNFGSFGFGNQIKSSSNFNASGSFLENKKPNLPGNCYNCNEPGHFSRDCPNPKSRTNLLGPQNDYRPSSRIIEETGSILENIQCFFCKEFGHYSTSCPNRKVIKGINVSSHSSDFQRSLPPGERHVVVPRSKNWEKRRKSTIKKSYKE